MRVKFTLLAFRLWVGGYYQTDDVKPTTLLTTKDEDTKMKKAQLTFNYAKEICTDRKKGQLVVNLYERWLDEKEYEDINEYGEYLEKQLGFDEDTLLMTKRPFGFKFKSTFGKSRGISHITCKLKGNSIALQASFTPITFKKA